MPATEDDLFQRFADLGIETTTVRHPPVYTVEEAKALRGDLAGGHIKNLFLKDKKGALWLVVVLEDRAIDLKALRHAIGAAQLSFGKPDLLMDVLGIEPGAVTPLSLINDTDGRVIPILDAALMDYDVVNCHPLTNAATTAIAPQDLLRFIRACGHEPRTLDLQGISR